MNGENVELNSQLRFEDETAKKNVGKMGRSKGITVLLNPGETLPATSEISVQPMTLQQLFVAMCGREV